MDNFDNLFSMTTPLDNDTSWISLQHNNNNNNNGSFDFIPTTIINNNIDFTTTNDNNIQIQELHQQTFEQGQPQYLQPIPTILNNTITNNYQQQQPLQPIIDINTVNITSQQYQHINPILDQQISNSMKLYTHNYNNTTTVNTKATKKTTTTTTTKNGDNKSQQTQPQPNNINNKEEKNRIYHKKHREKKKDYVKEIENQIAALTLENQELTKENDYIKIKGEGVDFLKPNNEEITIYRENMNIVFQMKEALEKNDERSLIYLLHLYHSSFTKVYPHIERDVSRLFHPNIQLALSKMSYIPHIEPQMYDIISGPGSDLWIDQYKEEAELTIEQSIKMDLIRKKYNILDKQCLKERLELDEEVKKLFYQHILMLPNNPLISAGGDNQPYISDISKTPLLNTKPLDLCQTLEFVNKIIELKNKVLKGRLLMLDFYYSLSSILTPKQETILYVRIGLLVSFHVSRFDMLNEVWSNIISSNSNALDIAGALEKYLNDTSDTTSTTTIPFSLQPATFNPPSLN